MEQESSARQKQNARRFPTPGQVLCIVATVVVVGLLVVLGYGQEWTGFGRSVEQVGDNRDLRRAKTLWDWLQLLVVPVALAILGFWFNRVQREQELARQESQRRLELDRQEAQRQRELQSQEAQRERELEVEDRRRQRELEIEARRAQEAALQSYLDQAGDLLLNNTVDTSDSSGWARIFLRARTLATLGELDGPRKGRIVRFLYEAGLISGEQPLISLSDADLIGVVLSGIQELGEYTNVGFANLKGINLEDTLLLEGELAGADMDEAVLTLSDLRGADLMKAKLNGANLGLANLTNAILIGAELNETRLNDANLSEAKLDFAELKGATLPGATFWNTEFGKADLAGADLKLADLGGADLESVRGLTQDQVNEAQGTAQGSGESKGRPDTKLPPHLEVPALWRKLPSEQLIIRRQELDEQREQLRREVEVARRRQDES
jgi:uncharacterized protein YjbI with pentapeptide repeats